MKLITASILGFELCCGQALAAHKTVYDCKVAHSARIEAIHLEGSEPAASSKNGPGAHFAIEIMSSQPIAQCDDACQIEQTVREVPPIQPRKSVYELCESGGNQILMHGYSAYAREGSRVDFRADKDPGFLRLIGPFNDGKTYLFWLSGFEYPGCEDTHLVIREGECKRRDVEK